MSEQKPEEKPEDYGWPIESGRKFESKWFTQQEIEAKCQENHWLRNRDAEDGIFTEYPTYDYGYSCYECKTLDELKRAFLYGNWSIRQCFTYKDLAFINQINAGDEWWALKKQKDGVLQEFDSITMIAVINSKPPDQSFEDYINELVEATVLRWWGYREVDGVRVK
jgi:hypothetical protein